MITLIGPLPEHLARGSRFHLFAEIDSAASEAGFARAHWAREALRRLHAETMAHATPAVRLERSHA